ALVDEASCEDFCAVWMREYPGAQRGICEIRAVRIEDCDQAGEFRSAVKPWKAARNTFVKAARSLGMNHQELKAAPEVFEAIPQLLDFAAGLPLALCGQGQLDALVRAARYSGLKGIDNKEGTADVGLPLITFTARTLSNGKQQLQVIHTAPIEQESAKTYLAKVDLAGFLGQWVEVTETVTFASEGKYELVIRRISDGAELVRVAPATLPLWRTGTTGLRPKWGLYRWFGENRSGASLLRDECLKFADFFIEKI
ncbi:MAG: hypothetical protein ACI395_00270, partial [Candidatus Cryptobacteroides sp.]